MKSIQVNDEIWEKLQEIKLKDKYKSVSEVIGFFLVKYDIY